MAQGLLFRKYAHERAGLDVAKRRDAVVVYGKAGGGGKGNGRQGGGEN